MRLAFALLDDGLAAPAFTMADDDLLLHVTVVVAPAVVMAAVAVLDDDLFADVTMTPAVMMAAVAGLDLHLHVLRERGSGERGRRKGQRRNGGSRKSKFPHVLLLREAG